MYRFVRHSLTYGDFFIGSPATPNPPATRRVSKGKREPARSKSQAILCVLCLPRSGASTFPGGLATGEPSLVAAVGESATIRRTCGETLEANMARDVQKVWEEFLDPNVMRPRLIAVSIYIAGFESLKESIVSRIRDFYSIGFTDPGEKLLLEYKKRVLYRNSSPVYASLDWLKEMKAIDDTDIDSFNRMKECRNTLAHKLFKMLGSEGLPADFHQCFHDMVALLRKIEVWWIVNVEIPTNPDFDTHEVDEGGIVPGPVWVLQLLCGVALGDEELSNRYFDAFRPQQTPASGADS